MRQHHASELNSILIQTRERYWTSQGSSYVQRTQKVYITTACRSVDILETSSGIELVYEQTSPLELTQAALCEILVDPPNPTSPSPHKRDGLLVWAQRKGIPVHHELIEVTTKKGLHRHGRA